MSRSQALDRVRRTVDFAMIFASLVVLAWPVVFGGLAANQRGLLAWTIVIAVVAVVGGGVAWLARRHPLAQYGPVAAAVVMAAYLHARGGGVGAEVTWLIIVVAAIILVRQFLGSHTNQGLMRDLTRERAILARQAFRDPLTEVGNRAMFMDHARDALEDADTR